MLRKLDIVRFLIALVLLAGVFNVAERVDRSTWISHDSQSQVFYPAQGWQNGEYVACEISYFTNNNPPVLNCAAHDPLTPLRVMDVSIKGKVTKTPALFDCQLKDARISCHILNR